MLIGEWTHGELVARAERWLRNSRKCRVVFTELNPGYVDEVVDAFGFAAKGWTVLIECKISRADFVADLRKSFRNDGTGMGAERWYMAPPGLIKPPDLPEGWGLLEPRGGRIRKIIKAKLVDQRSAESLRKEILVASVLLARSSSDGVASAWEGLRRNQRIVNGQQARLKFLEEAARKLLMKRRQEDGLPEELVGEFIGWVVETANGYYGKAKRFKE